MFTASFKSWALPAHIIRADSRNAGSSPSGNAAVSWRDARLEHRADPKVRVSEKWSRLFADAGLRFAPNDALLERGSIGWPQKCKATFGSDASAISHASLPAIPSHDTSGSLVAIFRKPSPGRIFDFPLRISEEFQRFYRSCLLDDFVEAWMRSYRPILARSDEPAGQVAQGTKQRRSATA
ncbi:hypothetical protein DC522_15695 [Microvirga sp. KLBC 81]|nr:hypothetical protein DC522_15695 [Microvirga sp. KLBC 81]